MPPVEYCTYPPQVAADVEITTRGDGNSPSFIAGSAAAGRYLALGERERRLVALLDGTRGAVELCESLADPNEARPPLDVVTRFLSKLDEVGILAGERVSRPQQTLLPGNQFYARWSFFNPEPLFDRLLPLLRWIWTSWFLYASLLLMVLMAGLVLFDGAEIVRSGSETLRQHYVAVFFAAWLITISHEFAHGMTSRMFGGRATEVGALLIYYCMPALYCNVTGLHLIPQRSRRMWVIGAGIYWQLLLGSAALAVWFLFHPQTTAAQIAMIFVLGSVLDVVFNVNPLIKLDGYYFLSQWTRIPNLMDRSRAYWRAILRRVLFAEKNGEAPRFSPRERRILLTFGYFSWLYNLALQLAILWYASQLLMNWFQFAGLWMSALLVVAYSWKAVKKMITRKGNVMTPPDIQQRSWKRFTPAVLAICCAGALSMPWTASVGSYGALVAIPGREAVIRAAESASLIVLNFRPGEQIARGAVVGRMGNLDLEEQIVQIRTELARANTDIGKLTGELKVQRETSASTEFQLAQRRREFNDVDEEERQIHEQGKPGFVLASNQTLAKPQFPAAIAALQADAERLHATSTEADQELGRTRSLFNERLVARSVLEASEAKSSALAADLAAARERLNAAIIEHRRRKATSETAVNVANSALAAGRAQALNLHLQLEATRRLRESLEDRVALLERKRSQFQLIAPVPGTLFGEELPRMLGQYFSKGTEICRLADTSELMVRVLVAEEALGDITTGQKVRLKARAVPDQLFEGVVSRIGGESELDSNGQRSYRVELTIANKGGRLRPGMTVFARIDFGRHTIGWLAVHKLKQALRPELWML